MREELLKAGVLVFCCVLAAALWWVLYVMPRHHVEVAAYSCMVEHGVRADTPKEVVDAQWNACARGAAAEHETFVLGIVGY